MSGFSRKLLRTAENRVGHGARHRIRMQAKEIGANSKIAMQFMAELAKLDFDRFDRWFRGELHLRDLGVS